MKTPAGYSLKSFNKLMLAAGLLLGFVLLTVNAGLAQAPPDVSPDFVPGEILVKFQPHVSTMGAQRSLNSENLQTLDVSAKSGFVRIQVEPGREQEVIDELLARGDIEVAGVNHIIHTTVIPDDTYYGSHQWALPKIEAPAAWDITTGNSAVIVGIVDSGLDTSHPEFAGRIVSPRDEVDNDSTPQDNCSHGTHVAGIAAAEGNNNEGIAGLAWNTKIMPVRSLGTCSGTEQDVADGIYWAVSHGAKIINLSLGGPKSSGSTCQQTFPVMSDAVDYALDAGVMVVAAAGNSGSSSILCPAAMNGVITVGSTDSDDSRSWFSNYGSELDLVAPGNSIYSTVPSGSYEYKNGTSMATPYVSGLASLIWSVAPSLTKAQVTQIIQNNTDDLGAGGWDQYFGHGRINARQALQGLNLQVSTPQLTLFVDDEEPSTSSAVQVITFNPDVITWTATISPAVLWLDVSPPASGTISTATSPSDLTIMASSSTITYTDTPTTTTLVITGTTSSGTTLVDSTEVKLIYAAEIFEYRFPIIFKQ